MADAEDPGGTKGGDTMIAAIYALTATDPHAAKRK
jgi:hypothetical protein